MKITARLLKDINMQTFAQLRNRLKTNGKVVRVGLPGTKKYRKGATPVSLVGAVHEFGSPEKGIPERPWLRPGVRSGQDSYIRLNRVNLIRVMRGEMSLDTALRQLGVMAVGFVQRYIRNGTFAPLKPATIKAKGSSKPLIDTGQMIQSVTSVVEKKEE